VIEWLQGAIEAFDSMGPPGYVLFVAAYIVAGLLLLPEAAFTIAAGALFGMFWGTLIAWASANVTAALAFFAARTALRERVERLAENNKWMKAVNHALPKEGWKVVALARLSPLLPFGAQNYFFGVTKVRRRDYLLATAIAILPGTVVYAFLGATGRALMDGGDALRWTMLAIGIIASIALTIFLGRLAKKRLGIDG
jgi:uncharacterized membrane protein YdjX (TVP38/TMEM64 family)